jgi:hypothetical protein
VDQSGSKWQKDGENYVMRNLLTCTLHHVIRVNKSRRMRWAGHVARMGEEKFRQDFKRKP